MTKTPLDLVRDLNSAGLDYPQLSHLITLLFCLCLVPVPLPPQGLFRLAAAASVVKRLKTCLDQEAVDHGEFSMDPHAVAGEDVSATF